MFARDYWSGYRQLCDVVYGLYMFVFMYVCAERERERERERGRERERYPIMLTDFNTVIDGQINLRVRCCSVCIGITILAVMV